MTFLDSRLKLSLSSVPFTGRDQRWELEIQFHEALLLPKEVRTAMNATSWEVWGAHCPRITEFSALLSYVLFFRCVADPSP